MTVSGLFYLAPLLLWWWLGALAFGVVVALATAGRGKAATSKATDFLPWIVLILVSLVISIGQFVEGRAGLWFDSAVILLVAYFVGCCIGALLRVVFGTRERIVSSDNIPALAGSAKPAPPPAALETIKPYQWQALKQDGTLTLTGYVPSAAIKTRIMAAAKALLPKLSVVDRLQMGAGAPDALETFAGAAFGHLAKLDSGTASLVDTAYTLSGTAKSESAKAAVVKMTSSLPPGFALSKANITLIGASAPSPEPAPPIPVATPMADMTAGLAAEVEAAIEPAAAMPTNADKPEGLEAPRGGKADDLKRIKGIGRQNEGRLHELGIWHFDQIAGWDAKQVAWVGHFLAFPGRIEREQWVAQAKALAAGGETDFSKRVDQGVVKTSSGGVTAEAPLLVEPMPASTPAGSLAGDSPAEAATDTLPSNIATPSYRATNALDAARNGKPDWLTYVNGIDPAMEARLNAAGIFHFDQLAKLSKDELATLSAALGAPGKAAEDNWKGEAAMLAIGSDTDHSKAMKAATSSLSEVVPKKG